MTATNRLSAHDLRRVAVEADVDPRSVARVLAGERTTRPVRAVVVAALARMGLSHVAPQESATAA